MASTASGSAGNWAGNHGNRLVITGRQPRWSGDCCLLSGIR